MYDDLPDWRLYFGAIENLYHEHPVKIDIAGTIESIDEITADHLYECYETFYHPSNMVLFIVGAVDPEEMIEFVKKDQFAKTFKPQTDIVRTFPEEPLTAAIPKRTLTMDVTKPKLSFGMKCTKTDVSGHEMLVQELSSELVLDILFGRASQFYEDAYRDELIDESYSYSFSMENGFGFAMIVSDTENPDALEARIRETLQNAVNAWSVTEEQLERLRKRKIGQFMRSLNSIEFIANQFTRFKFNDMDLFDVVPTLENITIDDLQKAYATFSNDQGHTVFTVVPAEKNADE